MKAHLIKSAASRTALTLFAFGLATACGGGGGGGGSKAAPGPDPVQSSFTATTTFGSSADGIVTVELSTLVADRNGAPLANIAVEFRASGFGNILVQPATVTDEFGMANGSIASTAAEAKTVRAIASPGVGERELGVLVTEFIELQSNTYYVRESGSDGASGASPLDAWRSLPYAISQVGAGDTIYVGAGIYDAIEITTVATASEPLVIWGDHEGVFTGDAGDVLVDAGGGTHGVKLDHAAWVTLRGFSIHGATAGAAEGGGVWITFASADNHSIVGCSLFENDRGLHIEAARSLILEGNRVSANTGDGITLGFTLGVSVVNNLIYSNGDAGLALTDTSALLSVGLNTFYRNAGYQVDERVSGSTGEIFNNVMSEGGSGELQLTSVSNFTPNANLTWGLGGGAAARPEAPDPGSVIADPLFANPAGNDGVLGGHGSWDDDFRALAGGGGVDAGDREARDIVLSFSGSMAGHTTRSDELRDGQAPDAATINLGAHESVPTDVYASIGPSSGRLAYALPGSAVLRTAERGSDGVWTPPTDTLVANSEARWVVHRVADGRPDEISLVLAETTSEAQLFLRRWNGRRWSERSTPIATLQLGNAGERGFDAEYESQSGDALIAYSNNDDNPVFRTLSNGVLSEPAPVFATPLGTGTVLWVELVAETGSDRVAMVALDDDQRLTASVWDGTAWSNAMLLDTQITTMREFKAFDAAWESLSGELLVVWGFSTYSEHARIATLDQNGTWAFSLYTNSEALGAIVKLAADPVSDQIATVFGEGLQDDDVTVSTWNGDAFVQTAEVTLRGVFGQHSIDVGWIGSTGRAFATWRDDGGSGVFMTARFDKTWSIESQLSVVGVGAAVQTEIRAVPGTDRAEAVIMDASGSLFHFDVTWNGVGTEWTLKNGGLALETGFDMMNPTRTFSFDVRQ